MCAVYPVQEMDVTFLNPALRGLGEKLTGIFMFSYNVFLDFSWGSLSVLIVDICQNSKLK